MGSRTLTVTSQRTANAFRYLYGERMPITCPIASGRVIKVGQLVSMVPAATTSTFYCFLPSSSNNTISAIVGVAMEDHLSVDGIGTILVDASPFSVYANNRAASANGVAIGQVFKYASAGGLAKSSTTTSKNDIMVCVENTTATTAQDIKVKFRFGKSFLDLSEDS